MKRRRLAQSPATASAAKASFAAAIALASLLAPGRASADPAAAEALFREGRRLLDEGKFNEACPKLGESQAQDPSSGTLLNLGLCHQQQHKLATAWSDYVSAARLAREQGRGDRAAVAEKEAAALEPRLPYLTVTAASPVAGLEILRGDLRLGLGVLGSAVPLDPGSYVVTASAPGYRSWKTTIDVAESESKTVQVPPLEPEVPAARAQEGAPGALPTSTPTPSIAPQAAGAASATTGAAATASPASAPRMHRSNTLAWVIGGAGMAALGVGTAFGIASLSSYHNADAQCPSHNDCSDTAISARSSAETKAWITNVALGVGVVAVGVWAYLLLSGNGRRAEPETRVAVHPGAGGMRVSLERSF